MVKRLLHITALLLLVLPMARGQHYAIQFVDSDDFGYINNIVGDNIRSVELWFKPDIVYNEQLAQPASLFYRDTPDQNNEFGLYIGPSNWSGQEGRLVFSRQVGTTHHHIVSDANIWEADRWYHVAGVLDPVEGMKLYINGQIQQQTESSVENSGQSIHWCSVGAWNRSGARLFKGQIDDLSVWDKAISAEQIQDNMWNAVDTAQADGLAGYWNFNEGQGNTSADLSGNNHEMTISSSQWQITGTALQFDGKKTSVNLGHEVADSLRTIEMWFRPGQHVDQTLSEPAALIHRDVPNGAQEFGLYLGPKNWNGQQGRLVFFYSTSGSTVEKVVSDQNSWNAGQWYHVAGVYHPTQGMQLYVNGVKQQDTNPNFKGPVKLKNEAVYLGTWGYREIRYFNGVIDEVKLWTEALSPEQISSNMCNPLAQDELQGLKAYYQIDKNEGSVLTDQTGKHSDKSMNEHLRWVEIRPCYQTEFNEVSTHVFNTKESVALNINAFPNPFVESSSIVLPENLKQDWHLFLFDVNGKVIQSKSGNDSTITITREELPSGIYFIQLHIDKGQKILNSRLIAR